MAKSKWADVKDKLTLVEGWARDGLTDDQIATKLGINRATFYRYKEQYCDFCDALKKGKEVVDFEVENALLKNAMSGNITAQIFWLKNRKPDKWRDKPEEKITAESKVVIVNDLPDTDNEGDINATDS